MPLPAVGTTGDLYLRSMGKMFTVHCERANGLLHFHFPYHDSPQWKNLKDEIKALEGARFAKTPVIHWTAADSPRNHWTLEYMDCFTPDPYGWFDRAPEEVTPNRECMMGHQRDMLNRVLTYHYQILAAEMGTGKTLVAIEALEKIKPSLSWYVAPRFALHAIRQQFEYWGAKHMPILLSYDDMKSTLGKWIPGVKAPQVVIFDESAYVKTPKSQRSLFAKSLADGVRADHKQNAYVILMSGAPAPKSPEDWWMQCEIACPGFLKEADPYRFRDRLAVISKETSVAGGSYDKVICFKDDVNKCGVCGKFKDDPIHHLPSIPKMHIFRPTSNEVERLYERLKGLVVVKRKSECTDLPEKTYREVNLKPSPAILEAARFIIRTSETTINALTRLRELSDGFQYKTMASDVMLPCTNCNGQGVYHDYLIDPEAGSTENLVECFMCNGMKTIPQKERRAELLDTPKDQALRDLLEENEEQGRIVVFAGFTASVTRVCDLCVKQGWAVVRADGLARKLDKSGIWASAPLPDTFLNTFQDKSRRVPKMAFVANQATAKTALTLTEAWMSVYYSNSFNGDDRIQSEDRIHRLGMDTNHGGQIVDLLHLPTDTYVLNNLKGKRRLQDITLGVFQEEVERLLALTPKTIN